MNKINKEVLNAAICVKGLSEKEALNSTNPDIKKAATFLKNQGLYDNRLGIELVIAMTSLYRPGPNKEIPNYIKNQKTGKFDYITPELEHILDVTNGIIVYQEQVMQIVRDLAGYSWGRSDIVRRAMSKKHIDEIEAERQIFVYGGTYVNNKNETINVPGCVNSGISEDKANAIYDKMVDFAKYAFNKSHATAYAVTSFKCAWFKEYYPEEYFCSIMCYEPSIEEIAGIIADAKDFGIDTLPPDINKSKESFSVKDGNILFGLGSVKGVGASADEIVKVRNESPFTDFKDFIYRCRIKKNALSNLIDAGAFDCFGYKRSQLYIDNVWINELLQLVGEISKKENFIKAAKKVQNFINEYSEVESLKERITKEGISFQITGKKVPTKESIDGRINNAKNKIEELKDDFDDIDIEETEDIEIERLRREKNVLGLYLTGHPINQYSVFTESISDAEETVDGALSGIIQNLEIKKNPRGQEWASFELSDTSGVINCVCFANDYKIIKDILKEDAALKLCGTICVDEFRTGKMNDDIDNNITNLEDNESIVLQFQVNSASLLKRKGSIYRLFTKNIATWVNCDYKKVIQYKENNGEPLQIVDEMTGLTRFTSFNVSSNILDIGAEKILL